MTDSMPAGGDILVYSKVRDPEARMLLRAQLENLPGERGPAAAGFLLTTL